jgi:geranylgeranyl diphosphate synthase type I
MQFSSYKTEILSEIHRLLTSQNLGNASHAWAKLYATHGLEYTSRGRMLRGSLLIQAWMAITGMESPVQNDRGYISAVSLAAMIEFLESGFLLHDDIFDRDDVRRGELSGHRLFEQISIDLRANQSSALNADDASLAGTSFATLLGDVLFFFLFRCLSSSQLTPSLTTSQRVASIEEFSHFALITALGESADISAGLNLEVLEIDQIFQMYRDKTSSYSFCLPLGAAARLANADEQLYQLLQKVGLELGVVYQLLDDWKGVFASSEETGKMSGGDVREGKRTPLLCWTLEQATDDARNTVQLQYGNPQVDEAGLSAIRAIMKQTGAVEKLASTAEAHLTSVQTMLDREAVAPPALSALLKSLMSKFSSHLAEVRN